MSAHEIQEKFITAAEFWELIQRAEYDDKHVELVNGEIVIMPPPSALHGEIVSLIVFFFRAFLLEHPLGRLYTEIGYILNPGTVRAPDVSFVRGDRLPNGSPIEHIPFPPDLAVEVVSPGNSASELHNKVTEYLDAGTLFVWVVYPIPRHVVVHTAQGAKTYREGDTLDGGHLLPGFTLEVRKIFPES